MSDSAKLQQQLHALQKGYSLQLPEKLNNIAMIHQQLQTSLDFDSENKKLKEALHKLAGSACTYGFHDLSKLAKKAKSTCLELEKDSASNQLQDKLSELITELVNTEITYSSIPNLNQEQKHETNSIDIYGGDTELNNQIDEHLEQYQYDINRIQNLDTLIEKINTNSSCTVIIDTESLEELEHIEKAINLQSKNYNLIIISTLNSFEARLASVRCGCNAFLSKPIDYSTLDEQLATSLNNSDFNPYKILIINDQKEQTDYYSLLLQQAYFDVHSINQSKEIISALSLHNPEVILMDMNMPECDGVELSKVIRQYQASFDIPIIFLSASNLGEISSQARLSESDGYLVKPIVAEELVYALRLKAQRYRQIKSIMNSDALTGLLNHSNCKIRLTTEILRAKRFQEKLSIALIDIDYFKKVNDNHGHLTGDNVIKNLSTLLKLQLRRTDTVGRYGGEEFIVILPNTSAHDANQVIEKIRKQFSVLETQAASAMVFCTFSAGITEIKSLDQPETMIKRADEALYAAKAQGRNRVLTK